MHSANCGEIALLHRVELANPNRPLINLGRTSIVTLKGNRVGSVKNNNLPACSSDTSPDYKKLIESPSIRQAVQGEGEITWPNGGD